MAKRRNKSGEYEIAKERIEKLLSMAKGAASDSDLGLANRYVKQAWNIKLKFRVRLPLESRRLFCRKCLSFFAEGKTSRVRTKDRNLIITCLSCGHLTRAPLRQRCRQTPR